MAFAPDGKRRRGARILAVRPDLVRRRVIVHGRVQGVWFRGSLSERARADGVGGWAANRADGTVEAVLEGPPEAVERVIRFCRTGPPRADVHRVAVSDEPPRGVSEFTVR